MVILSIVLLQLMRPQDGTPTLRLNEFMLASLAANKVDHGSDTVRSGLLEPKELTFELDATSTKFIGEAESHFDALMAQHDMEVRHHPPICNARTHLKNFCRSCTMRATARTISKSSRLRQTHGRSS